jgi:hypothetical protein
MRALRALPLCLALAVALPPVALAQPARSGAPAEASAHFQRGTKLYTEQDFRAALIEFQRAYQIAPNFSVLYNIGQSNYQLQDYASALQSFEHYLADGKDRVPAERRAEVSKDIDELRGRVAMVTFKVNEAGAEIAVDDVPVGKSPLPGPVRVSAGRRKLTATREGRPTTTRTLDIAGGDRLDVELTLAAPATTSGPGPVAASAPAPSPPPPPPPAGPGAFTYGALTVGAVGLAVGSVFGVLALSTRSSLDGACQSKVCPSSKQGDIDALSRNATVSTIGFGVGLLGAAAGLYGLLSGPAAPPAAARGPSFGPWVGPGSAGLSGSF